MAHLVKTSQRPRHPLVFRPLPLTINARAFISLNGRSRSFWFARCLLLAPLFPLAHTYTPPLPPHAYLPWRTYDVTSWQSKHAWTCWNHSTATLTRPSTQGLPSKWPRVQSKATSFAAGPLKRLALPSSTRRLYSLRELYSPPSHSPARGSISYPCYFPTCPLGRPPLPEQTLTESL